MFAFIALFQNQEVSNVFTLPSYFLPIFLTVWILGLVLSIGAIVLVIKTGKSSLWLLLTAISLFLYFLHWIALGFAMTKGETATWITVSFLNFFAVLAVAFILINVLKTKEA